MLIVFHPAVVFHSHSISFSSYIIQNTYTKYILYIYLVQVYYKMKKMSAERSKISSKLILLQAAWDTSIARTTAFVYNMCIGPFRYFSRIRPMDDPPEQPREDSGQEGERPDEADAHAERQRGTGVPDLPHRRERGRGRQGSHPVNACLPRCSPIDAIVLVVVIVVVCFPLGQHQLVGIGRG